VNIGVGVVRQVRDVDAQPDLCGQVTHHVDAGQRAVERARIANVAHDEPVERRSNAAVHVRAQ